GGLQRCPPPGCAAAPVASSHQPAFPGRRYRCPFVPLPYFVVDYIEKPFRGRQGLLALQPLGPCVTPPPPPLCATPPRPAQTKSPFPYPRRKMRRHHGFRASDFPVPPKSVGAFSASSRRRCISCASVRLARDRAWDRSIPSSAPSCAGRRRRRSFKTS